MGILKPQGYFTDNTFDPGFTTFPLKERANMTWHTKEQAKNFFKNFKIISFKEIKKAGTVLGTFDHYYQIIGQKL